MRPLLSMTTYVRLLALCGVVNIAYGVSHSGPFQAACLAFGFVAIAGAAVLFRVSRATSARGGVESGESAPDYSARQRRIVRLSASGALATMAALVGSGIYRFAAAGVAVGIGIVAAVVELIEGRNRERADQRR